MKMHDNGAVVDDEGKLIVRFVYADRALRDFLYLCLLAKAASYPVKLEDISCLKLDPPVDKESP